MSFDLLPIQFRGVDEGASPKTQPIGTLMRAENCAMDKARRLGKRRGTDGYAKTRFDAGSITSAKRLVGYPNGEVGVIDDTLFNRVATIGTWQPVESKTTPYSLTSRSVADAARGIYFVDHIIHGDLLFSVYETKDLGGGAGGAGALNFVQVENLVTGQLVKIPTVVDSVATSHQPKIIMGATKAYILVNETAAANIKVRSIDYTTFALGALTTLVTDNNTNSPFSACIGTSTAGEVIYIAYSKNAGADRATIKSFLTATYAADQTFTNVGSGNSTANFYCVEWLPLQTKVGLCWSNTLGTNALITTKDLVISTARVSFDFQTAFGNTGFIAEYDATNVLLGSCPTTTACPSVNTMVAPTATLAVTAASVQGTKRLARPSRPWKANGRWFFAAAIYVQDDGVTFDTLPAASVGVFEITATVGVSAASWPHVQVATLENQTGWYTTTYSQCKASIDSDGNAWIASAYRMREPVSSADAIPVGWNIHKLYFDGDDVRRTAQCGAGLLMAGACPLWLDGAGAMPYGFAHAPKIETITAQAGGAMAIGTYTYVACYAWTDCNGVVHRSAPSPAFTGTTAGANLQLQIAIASSAVSSKQQDGRVGVDVANPVMIELYRTLVGGTVHYKLIETATLSTPQSTTIIVQDTYPDSDVSGSGFVPLSTQAVVYTETGELANIPPPALVTVAAHRGRLVGIDATRRTLWFSKDYTEDPQIAPGFNEALVLAFASDKTALSALDEKLVVYGERTIDVVHGDGPDATGSGSWQVQSVQTDVGCVNPRSVVAAPPGSLFLSQRGIELLSRDLTVSWVGKPVEDTLAAYPDITSAVLVADQHEVRWTCRSEDGLTGRTLVWDYLNQLWLTRVYTDESDTTADAIPFIDAGIIGGVYMMLTAGGQVYAESSTHFREGSSAGSYVERDIILAEISPAGPMGWSRAKDLHVLGTGIGAHDMHVKFARDYAVAYEQTKTFLAGTAPVAVGPLNKCRVTLKNQQLRAVRIQILDAAPTGGLAGDDTGQGAIYEGLALRVATKNGAARTTPAEQG